LTTLPTLGDVHVAGKRVLVRADLNVPLDDGRITDDFRIKAFLPTLERILERGGTAVVCSHLGRPKGPDVKYTLMPVATALSEALSGDVPLIDDYTNVPEAHVVLLENLRFHAGETKNDADFATVLTALGDVYVNDAFGSCHRAHASIVGPPSRLPSAAGLLLEREIENLSRLIHEPERPYVVIIGGSKVKDKIGVVKNLLERADAILLGGGMCFTFLLARGAQIGKSMVDDEAFIEVAEIVWDDKIKLPVDVVVADTFESEEAWDVVDAMKISSGMLGMDIGPETARSYAEIISGAKTVFWNGPMGVFEKDAFAAGSKRVAEAVASCDGFTATGGGDVSAALAKFGLVGKVDFASTGGGASLEFLEGRTLPGIAALTKES
jgi:phosphoglycerate kinase